MKQSNIYQIMTETDANSETLTWQKERVEINRIEVADWMLWRSKTGVDMTTER